MEKFTVGPLPCDKGMQTKLRILMLQPPEESSMNNKTTTTKVTKPSQAWKQIYLNSSIAFCKTAREIPECLVSFSVKEKCRRSAQVFLPDLQIITPTKRILQNHELIWVCPSLNKLSQLQNMLHEHFLAFLTGYYNRWNEHKSLSVHIKDQRSLKPRVINIQISDLPIIVRFSIAMLRMLLVLSSLYEQWD